MVDVFALHHALDTFVHSVALLLNVGLAYVIMRRSHGSLRAYKGIFMMTCVNDILLSAVALVAQTASFYDGKISVLYSNGFFARADPCVNYWLVITYITLVVTNMAFLPVPFLYRYYKICRGSATDLVPKLTVIPVCVLIVGFFTSWLLLRSDERFQWKAIHVVEQISGAKLNASWAAPRMFGLYNEVTEFSIYPYMALYTAVMVSVYTCIIWSEYHVMRKFRVMRVSMRSSTKQLHADIHNALLALAVCPIISMMIPSNIFLIGIIFHIDMGLLSPFLTIVLTSVTLLNPITTCYFVRPFRSYILNRFLCGSVPHTLRVTAISATIEGTVVYRIMSHEPFRKW